jgi:hypothetical protein
MGTFVPHRLGHGFVLGCAVLANDADLGQMLASLFPSLAMTNG